MCLRCRGSNAMPVGGLMSPAPDPLDRAGRRRVFLPSQSPLRTYYSV